MCGINLLNLSLYRELSTELFNKERCLKYISYNMKIYTLYYIHYIIAHCTFVGSHETLERHLLEI